MRRLHEMMLEAIQDERRRLSSRRGLLGGAAKLAAGGMLATSLTTTPAMRRLTARAQELTSDVDVLNFALTLEHLEHAFYRDGVPLYTFGTDPFGNSIDALLTSIGEHEAAHVDTLTQVISSLGGTPVSEATYNFGHSDASSFLGVAQALENTGVQAYDGAAAALQNAQLLAAAGTIVAVEARHASYLNLLNGAVPFPASFEETKSPSEVLEIAESFLAPAGATPAASPEA